MAFNLANKIVPDGGGLYWTIAYQTMIESHLGWIKSQNSTYVIQIDPGDAYKYDGDLTGLLTKYNVPIQHQYTVMRLNNLRAPTEYTSGISTMIIPDYQLLAGLDAVYASTYSSFG